MTEDEEKGQKPQSTENPDAELFQKGFHVFMGEVTMETMNPIINWIISANFTKEKQHKELTLGVCSPGGDLNACFACLFCSFGCYDGIKDSNTYNRNGNDCIVWFIDIHYWN